MKRMAVVTATRAEFGLLLPVIRELRKYENTFISIDLIVTGTHLCEKYGMTINEIEAEGIRIDQKIKIPVKSQSEQDISNNQAEALVIFTELFSYERYDAIIILGDRYEIFAVAIAAGNTKTPIFHLCGGDTTEGAIDEWIRHSITKMSYLHFVTNEDSRKRVIQLGEDPNRVFNYGSTSIDNIKNIEALSKKEALGCVGIDECKYAIGTYHPVTMDSNTIDYKIQSFLNSIIQFPSILFIITKSNSDQGGARINQLLDEAEKNIINLRVFTSLGIKKYISLMRHAEFVIGNSSSGIIETPVLGLPTINIGDRQRGRLQTDSIINCSEDTQSIVQAIKKAMNKEYKEYCKLIKSPYGEGDTGEQIAKKCIEIIMSGNINLKKEFYNLKTISLTS